MNNKRIEQLIPQAIKLLQNFPKEKVYQGYLAAFGPTVITSGIVQAVAFYTGDEKKNRVIKLMFDLIKEELPIQKGTLLEVLEEGQNYKNYALKNKILEASVACKLAIRTFELKE
ncbi:MAG: type III-B CRISPR module-associated protein Cmr5 [Arcobacteraceae bacterium]